MVTARIGVRRYRPDFDLWTIWGAFSPTPYRAVDGAVDLAPLRRLTVHVTGEAYRYDATGASAPLVTVQSSGWRFGWDGSYAVAPRWTLDAGYHGEFGPGASSRGFQGGVTYAPSAHLSVSAHAGTLGRPLEFRLDDASVVMFGGSLDYRPAGRWQFQADVTRYAESRNRPDAAAFDWNQLRCSARVVLLLGSGIRLAGVPEAVQAMPEAPAR